MRLRADVQVRSRHAMRAVSTRMCIEPRFPVVLVRCVWVSFGDGNLLDLHQLYGLSFEIEIEIELRDVVVAALAAQSHLRHSHT